MSVTIRLARVGKKHAPAYKVVVSNTKDKRNGKFLDVLGHYNPAVTPATFNVNQEQYQEWKSKGALETKAITDLLKGSYNFRPYKLKGKEAATE